jgi:hypothetical protein
VYSNTSGSLHLACQEAPRPVIDLYAGMLDLAAYVLVAQLDFIRFLIIEQTDFSSFCSEFCLCYPFHLSIGALTLLGT